MRPTAPAVLRVLARTAPALKARIFAATDHSVSREMIVAAMHHVPDPIQAPVLEAWRRREAREGLRAANIELRDFSEALWSSGISFAASDAEIEALAERKARSAAGYVADVALSTAEAVRDRLERFARTSGIAPPVVKSLRGLIVRMTDKKWWRRALRRELVRELERHAIRLGMVHKRASLYASREAVDRRAQQKKRNARALTAMTAENESGDSFTLAELASHSLSNPAVRRAELMTRIAGFEEFAQARGDVAMFYTLTCPSRMHARHWASGAPVENYDGTTPRGAQAYLRAQWAKARAALRRHRAYVYGFRIAEPHHDGTPHWHMLFFMRPCVAAGVTKILEHYATETDAAELSGETARGARFKAIAIDWTRGSAAGYVAKYVAKNVDGYRVAEDFEAPPEGNIADAVRGVDAWASTWGIRQFQQIGGPGVTIWRELRRLREPQGLPLFDGLIGAADNGLWRDYVRAMGGIEILKRDRTLQLWRVDYEKENRYGEPAPPGIEGVSHFFLEVCRTRMHEWSLGHVRRIPEAATAANREGGKSRAAESGTAARAHDAIAERLDLQRSVSRGPEGRAGFSGVLLQPENGARGDDVGAFDSPWTGVNNCTRVEESTDCAAWVADYERETDGRPPGRPH